MNLLGAIICYFALIFCLNYFIIQPKKSFSNKKSLEDAFILGLCIYAVYNFTNLATLKHWSPYSSVTDSLWGGSLFALTTYAVFL